MNVFGTRGITYWVALVPAAIFGVFDLFKKKPAEPIEKNDATK